MVWVAVTSSAPSVLGSTAGVHIYGFTSLNNTEEQQFLSCGQGLRRVYCTEVSIEPTTRATRIQLRR